MGLKEAFQKAAAAAFNAAGNVKIAITYSSVPNPTYVPATGVVTEAETDYSVNAIREEYKSKEIDNVNIKPKDIKFLILYEDLTIILSTKDYVTIGATRWNVVDWEIDPADALWTIQVRQ